LSSAREHFDLNLIMLSCNLGQFSQVCHELLTQFFGEIVGKVGAYLLRRGKQPLRDIVASTSLKENEVKKAVAILVQHNFIEFEPNENNPNIAEYSVIRENIYCLLRYPKYLFMMKNLFGDEAEVLLEELLNQGQDSASNLIFRSVQRLREVLEEDQVSSVSPLLLYEKLQNLALKKYIIRLPQLVDGNSKKIPTLVAEENLQFVCPTLDLGLISQRLQENSDQLVNYSDCHIMWRVNFEQFNNAMRKEILVNAAARRIDPPAGQLYHLLYNLWSDNSPPGSPISAPLTYYQIRDAVSKSFENTNPLVLHCDQYLKILAEDSSNLVTKSGDAGGGQYILNKTNVFTNMACATLDSIVLEKFGSKATRLFRLTRSKNYLEHDQMQHLSMISAKDTRTLSYQLLEHNFLQLKELRKGTSNTVPVKCFFLFYVDLPQVSRLQLELAYKGLHNALVRQQHELIENARLLEKQQRAETMMATFRDQGATEEEIEESCSISPSDKTLLAKVHHMSDKLTRGQMQVDETILILDTYLKFTMMK